MSLPTSPVLALSNAADAVTLSPVAEAVKSTRFKRAAARVVAEMDDEGRWTCVNITVNREIPLGPDDRRHAIRCIELALRENKQASTRKRIDAEIQQEEPANA